MATNFPNSVDSLTNPTTSDTLATVSHSGQHTDANDAIEAIQTALLDGAPLKIDDANNRVGIGTTSPAEELDVVGDVQVSGRLGIGSGISAELDIKGASNPEIRLQSTDSTDPFLYFGDQVDAVRGGIGYDTSADALLLRGYNNSTRLTIDSSGNVGIGTTSPSDTLDVAGNTTSTGHFTAQSGGADGGIVLGQAFSSAYVGLRTSNMSETSNNEYILISDGGHTYISAGNNNDLFLRGGGNDSACQIQLDSSANQINVDGHIDAVSMNISSIIIDNYTNPNPYYGKIRSVAAGSSASFSSASTSNSLRNHIVFSSPSYSAAGIIYTQNGACYYASGSDYRLKENIVPMTDAVSVVKQLRPSEYNYIQSPEVVHQGFIAHELQEHVPSAVSGVKDGVDEEGNPVYQNVDLGRVVPLLTAALQEALTTIDELTARIEALEAG